MSKPNKPGWYLFKWDDSYDKWQIVQVTDEGRGRDFFFETCGMPDGLYLSDVPKAVWGRRISLKGEDEKAALEKQCREAEVKIHELNTEVLKLKGLRL